MKLSVNAPNPMSNSRDQQGVEARQVGRRSAKRGRRGGRMTLGHHHATLGGYGQRSNIKIFWRVHARAGGSTNSRNERKQGGSLITRPRLKRDPRQERLGQTGLDQGGRGFGKAPSRVVG